MAMRVFIGVGHGGSDPGAVGIVHEANANLTISLELQRILEANGFTVGISRTRDENDDLPEEIAEANAFKPDLAIEVHNNAGGGDGWECYVQTNGYAAKSKAAAQALEKRVKAIGQQSRGLKTKKNSSGTADYFGWLRQVNAPAILTEGFFVDSSDAYDFDTVAEQKALANAYALGVMDYFGISTSASPNASVSSSSTGQLYRVRKTWGDAKSQLGAFSLFVNAKKACKAGYKVFDKSGNVVYDPAGASTSTVTVAGITYSADESGRLTEIPNDSEKEERTEMRYEKLRDVTSKTYRATLDKLVRKGIIKGREGSGDDLVIDLGEDAVRLLVYLDRAGAFGV